MRFASLGSGSKGNATVVAAGETTLLIDCGFSVRETERRLARLGLDLASLSAILVTHEHGDHCAGVAALSRRAQVPVYLTHGTWSSGRISDCEVCRFDAGTVLTVGDCEIASVPVPHDAREPVQYVIRHDSMKLGVLTDLGSVTPHVVSAYGNCDALLIEFNHDLDLLMDGDYPLHLKHRVGGDWGHLNNHQAAELLASLDTENLGQLVLGHLSENNNTPRHALDALTALAPELAAMAVVACQAEGFDWLPVAVDAGSACAGGETTPRPARAASTA